MSVFGLAHLLNECVAPRYRREVAAIVLVESSGEPYALNEIGRRRSVYPATLRGAVNDADAMLSSGHPVAVGLGQINSQNVIRFHLEGRNLFNGCTNLEVAQEVLADCYGLAGRVVSSRPEQELAWSCYYSGNFKQGFVPYHGVSYVARVGETLKRIDGE